MLAGEVVAVDDVLAEELDRLARFGIVDLVHEVVRIVLAPSLAHIDVSCDLLVALGLGLEGPLQSPGRSVDEDAPERASTVAEAHDLVHGGLELCSLLERDGAASLGLGEDSHGLMLHCGLSGRLP